MDIKKATESDKRELLQKAVREVYSDSWLIDYDDGFVYFDESSYDEGYKSETYQAPYTMENLVVTLGDKMRVERETVYTQVPEMSNESDESNEIDKGLTDKVLSDKVIAVIHDLFGKKGGDPERVGVPIVKQFDNEEMIAIEPMYCQPGVADGHGEGMDLDTIYKMVESANEAIGRGTLSGGLFHKENREDIEILKCWVNECPCVIGETEVPEGQPIVKVKFHNTELWGLRKAGKLKGLSIGGKGAREPNE